MQGVKAVATGGGTLAFHAGDTMLITADVPTVSQITQASRIAPYLSFALHLDPALIAELSVDMKASHEDSGAPLQLLPTDAEVSDAALRMMCLLDRPAAVPVLQRQLVREMHYWLLAGRHGPAIHQLGYPDSQARRIARAVEVIRSEFAAHLPVERLAAVAGMSRSTFHHHFRAPTSLSPLQFQKRLRLIEADDAGGGGPSNTRGLHRRLRERAAVHEGVRTPLRSSTCARDRDSKTQSAGGGLIGKVAGGDRRRGHQDCQTPFKVDPHLECAPASGHFQAADLTCCRAC